MLTPPNKTVLICSLTDNEHFVRYFTITSLLHFPSLSSHFHTKNAYSYFRMTSLKEETGTSKWLDLPFCITTVRMREPEYRRKNLLAKGREITQQDLNKGQHGRKVSALILLHHHASLLSGTCLTTLLNELP